MEETTFGTLVLKYIWLAITLGVITHIIVIRNSGKKLERNECGFDGKTSKQLSYLCPLLASFLFTISIFSRVFGIKMEEGEALFILFAVVCPYITASFFTFKMLRKKIVVQTDYLEITNVLFKKKVSYSK